MYCTNVFCTSVQWIVEVNVNNAPDGPDMHYEYKAALVEMLCGELGALRMKEADAWYQGATRVIVHPALDWQALVLYSGRPLPKSVGDWPSDGIDIVRLFGGSGPPGVRPPKCMVTPEQRPMRHAPRLCGSLPLDIVAMCGPLVRSDERQRKTVESLAKAHGNEAAEELRLSFANVGVLGPSDHRWIRCEGWGSDGVWCVLGPDRAHAERAWFQRAIECEAPDRDSAYEWVFAGTLPPPLPQ